MEEFTVSTLRTFIDQGYRFLLYHNMEHFAIVKPLLEECEPTENSYIISILDEQALEMANGVDDFSYYVFPA